MSKINLSDKSITLRDLIRYLHVFVSYYLEAAENGEKPFTGWEKKSSDLLLESSLSFICGIVRQELKIEDKNEVRELVAKELEAFHDHDDNCSDHNE